MIKAIVNFLEIILAGVNFVVIIFLMLVSMLIPVSFIMMIIFGLIWMFQLMFS